MSQDKTQLRRGISEIYTQKDIIRDRNNLLKDPTMLSTFISYGIPRDLLETFIIGLDTNNDIVLPVTDQNGDILGKLSIKNFQFNGGTYMTKANGLVGLALSEDKKVTICKNIVDLLIAYKMGFSSPILVPDRINPPSFFKTYQEYYFMDPEDTLIDMAPGLVFTYDIKSLYHHVIERKEIPEARQLVSGENEAFIQRTNPAIVDGKFWWLIKRMYYAVDPDGMRRRTLPNKYLGRRLTVDSGVYYLNVTPASMHSSFVREKVSPKKMFNHLVQTFMETAFFLSEAQARLISLYIMYQYVYPILGYRTHLSVVFTSEREMKYFHRIMKLVLPTNQSFYSKGTSSAAWTNTNITTFDAPPLVYTEHITNDLCGNRGISILIDKMLNPTMRSVESLPLEPIMIETKNMLYNFSFDFDPFPKMPKHKSNMIDQVMPLFLIATSIGMSRLDFNNLFRLTVKRSRSIIPRYNMNNLRSAGVYANEQVFEDLNEETNEDPKGGQSKNKSAKEESSSESKDLKEES